MTDNTHFSFQLPEAFVDAYATREVNWGFPVADGVSLGEITFLRTYSRLKPDGSKERWHEVCARVINGMFSIQKNHCLANRLPWSDEQAYASAAEAYARMFEFKWTPPGRGLWAMGTPMVMNGNSAALQNCAFISTDDHEENNPGEVFAWIQEASMLGIGVGLNTAITRRNHKVEAPSGSTEHYEIPDTREGWVESTRRLINSYLVRNNPRWTFDYSKIRPAGTPIATFGGTASGPGPLIDLHSKLTERFEANLGNLLTTELVADIANLIGVCTASGNVRRSALIILGDHDDDQFLNLKNPEVFPERNSFSSDSPGWAWMSNNSVYASIGDNYDSIAERIADNGEPGLVWMDVARSNGRAGETNYDDYQTAGVNPCAEQILESREFCTLVETYLPRHTSLNDYLRTLKYAYMYGKSVTLLATHWPEANAVMARNRRIGLSMSGVAEFADAHGLPELRRWMRDGYSEVQQWDDIYSRWLCVRESVRTTTIKPSGTVSLLAGTTPGIHWSPGGQRFNRTIRFAADDPTVALLEPNGYRVEDDVVSPGTKVVYFPVATSQKRSESDVTIFEKAHMAAFAQTHWADNGVSVTVTFNPETEADSIGTAIHMNEGTLKSVSFLPSDDTVYPQMPFSNLSEDDYETAVAALYPVDLSVLYDGYADGISEAGCESGICEVQQRST